MGHLLCQPNTLLAIQGRTTVGKYTLIDIPMMWEDGQAYCKANGFKTMATVHSATEGKQVRSDEGR